MAVEKIYKICDTEIVLTHTGMKLLNSIRLKTILAMTMCVALLFLVITMVTSKIISDGFEDIENQKVSENLERIFDSYKYNLANLGLKLADWSSWDDTFKYIGDKNSAFVESNLVYSTLINLKINYMIFVNNQGVVVEGIGVDESSGGRLSGIPEDLRRQIFKDSQIVTHTDELSEKSGLLLLREGPLMFVSRPILTSNGKGPIKGSVIFARYLDLQEVKNLSDLTHLNFSIIRVDGSITSGERAALDFLTDNNAEYIKPESSAIVNGYKILNDFYGKPALLFRIDYPRVITNQGSKSVTYFVYAFIVAGLLFLFALSYFLSRFLLDRIERLSKEVTEIGENGLMNHRVEVSKENDEISQLSIKINGMLDRLMNSQLDVRKEREKVNTFFDIVSGIVVVLSRGGKILSINRKGGEFLGVSEDSATGRNWVDFVPEEDREWVKKIFDEIIDFGNIDKYEYFEHPVINKDGKPEMFGWYNSVLRDPKGMIIATVSHGENVAKIGSK